MVIAKFRLPSDPDGVLDELGVEWIPIRRAATLVKSPHCGKQTHVNTVRRWIRQGRLDSRRRRLGLMCVRYVRLDQVLEIAGALEADKLSRPERPVSRRTVRKVLRRAFGKREK